MRASLSAKKIIIEFYWEKRKWNSKNCAYCSRTKLLETTYYKAYTTVLKS